MRSLAAASLAIFCAFSSPSPAANVCGCLHHSEAGEEASAVVVATVTDAESRRPGKGRKLRTHYAVSVEEVEKGSAKRGRRPWTSGGILGAHAHQDGSSIALKSGRRYRLFLDDKDRVIAAEPLDDPDFGESGGGGGTTASGFLDGETGIPGRYTIPDQGRPIEYFVDADVLPAGISQSQALAAVEAAFAAWASATKISFRFGGIQSFGTGATDVPVPDEAKLYIQLHDSYGEVTTPSALGIGGRSLLIYDYNSAGGGGGTVDGQAFHHAAIGYVVIKHTKPEAQNPVTLEEILTHEIGHALGLAHSSENPFEINTAKKESIMYYQIHGDGRGASLGSYDVDTIRVGYPNGDTPPFSVDRTIVGSNTAVVPGVNQINLLPRDLVQPSGSLAVQAEAVSTPGYGPFSKSGNTLTYTFGGNYGNIMLSDSQIIAGAYYDRYLFRISDGTHLSPYYLVRVVGNDTSPSTTIAAPAVSISAPLYSVSWTTEPFKTYEVQTSSDGSNWTTNQLLWATSTSESSSSYVEKGKGFRLIRVRAHP